MNEAKRKGWPWLAAGLALLVYSAVVKRYWPELHVDGLDGGGLVCVLWYLLPIQATSAKRRFALMVGVGVTLLIGLAVLVVRQR